MAAKQRQINIVIVSNDDLSNSTWKILDETSEIIAHGQFAEGGSQTIIVEDGGLNEDLLYRLVEYALEG